MSLLSITESLENYHHPIFHTQDKSITGEAFVTQVNNCAGQIKAIPHQRIGLYFTSTYDFSVALLGVLKSNKTPVILPQVQPGFLDAIAQQLDLLITDTETQSSLDTVQLSSLNTQPTQNSASNESSAVNHPIELFTSGSTGRPKRIIKSLAQLEAEVEALQHKWGDQIDDSLLVSTVSHQHIYGLLFKVLWPLSFTHEVWDGICHYPEQWLTLTRGFPSISLISSPAHLKRAHSLVDLSPAKGIVKMIFSSGGPLAAEDSKRVYQHLQTPVVEVYGSTETGGIASRHQFGEEPAGPSWHALPGVELEQDPETGCLNVQSPYTGVEGWYRTSDLIEMTSSQNFVLKGRADRIVKIEEKRVSLTEIENCLSGSALVDQVASVALTGQRNMIGCVIVLSQQGLDYYSANGKTALNKTLKHYLSQYFETVVLPRKWRYVSELPLNEQGKLMLQSLNQYFQPDHQNPTQPIITRTEILEKETQLWLKIPPDLEYFDGHFLKKPVVPGVVQIEWAGSLGQQHFGFEGEFSELEVIKFHEFIYPGDEACLTLAYSEIKNKLTFSYTSERGKHSSGRIAYLT